LASIECVSVAQDANFTQITGACTRGGHEIAALVYDLDDFHTRCQPLKSEQLSIDGPAGLLECIFECSGDEVSAPTAVAVVCHPHPLHGGTMGNKVAHTLSRAFVAQNAGALRFNFRGVGKSEGSFDEGAGELDDVLCAIDYCRTRFPDLPLWLAGFSFGAAMAIRAATTDKIREEIAGLISVAPAAFRLADDRQQQPDCPWLLVHGDNDELVDIDDTIEWLNSLQPGPEFCVFPDTTHFFHGKLTRLRDVVMAFIGKHQ